MTTSLRDLARRERGRLDDTEAWIAWVRLLAVPFAFLEVAVERGNYPPGHEGWAWAVTAVFAVGGIGLFLASRRPGADSRPLLGAVALVFDTAVVSAYAAIYAFEPGSPVRQLFFLVVIEAALRFGRRGGVLWPLASAPALAVFEWRQSDRLELPFDPGHVIFPIALQVLVGLIVGSLAARTRR